MHQLFQSLPLVPPGFRLFFYGLAGLAVALFIVGTLDRILLWQQGRDRPSAWQARTGAWGWLQLSLVRLFSTDCLLARRTFARGRLRGVMVVCILWGSLGLLAGVVFSAAAYLAPTPLVSYGLRRAFGLLVDITGGLLLVGLLLALSRRYLFRPTLWVSITGDGLVLTLFILTVGLGYVMKGARLAAVSFEPLAGGPVGSLFGLAWSALTGGDGAALTRIYPGLYLLHAGVGLALLAYLPFSKLFHLFAAQITMFAARREAQRLYRPARLRPHANKPAGMANE